CFCATPESLGDSCDLAFVVVLDDFVDDVEQAPIFGLDRKRQQKQCVVYVRRVAVCRPSPGLCERESGDDRPNYRVHGRWPVRREVDVSAEFFGRHVDSTHAKVGRWVRTIYRSSANRTKSAEFQMTQPVQPADDDVAALKHFSRIGHRLKLRHVQIVDTLSGQYPESSRRAAQHLGESLQLLAFADKLNGPPEAIASWNRHMRTKSRACVPPPSAIGSGGQPRESGLRRTRRTLAGPDPCESEPARTARDEVIHVSGLFGLERAAIVHTETDQVDDVLERGDAREHVLPVSVPPHGEKMSPRRQWSTGEVTRYRSGAEHDEVGRAAFTVPHVAAHRLELRPEHELGAVSLCEIVDADLGDGAGQHL